MKFKLIYILILVLFLNSCITSTSNINLDPPNVDLKIKNKTTNETVIVPLFGFEKTVILSAHVGDELDFNILIDDIEQDVLDCNLKMFILSSEISIDKLPSNFQYTISQVPSENYPIVVGGEFKIGEVVDKIVIQQSSYVIYKIQEKVYARILVLEKMDD